MTPANLEMWLILAYVGVVLIAARGVEALAQAHFARARRHDEDGFEYVAAEDHYLCASGERLRLQAIDHDSRRAIYRAHASSCRVCPLKQSCTPHEDGRLVYRSIVTWPETDVGRFHQRLSILMSGAGGVLSTAGLWQSRGQPGANLLFLALLASAWSLRRDLARSGVPEH
jgi:hypothetical protein